MSELTEVEEVAVLHWKNRGSESVECASRVLGNRYRDEGLKILEEIEGI